MTHRATLFLPPYVSARVGGRTVLTVHGINSGRAAVVICRGDLARRAADLTRGQLIVFDGEMRREARRNARGQVIETLVCDATAVEAVGNEP